ncbi:MAG: CapA family protein [Bacteroidaceae bacterium]|nr:CapA family protein [Bacteroidaceae bacterium]
MKSSFFTFHFSLFTLLMLLSCSANSQTNGSDTDSLNIEEPQTQHISLLFAGDLMQHGPQIKGALQADGTYDYSECFRYMKQEISEADVAIVNFETTLAEKPYTGYPTFSAPDEFLRDCQKAGFDIMLTANNHSCDKGKKGIERTIMMMDSLHIPHLGSYVDEAARKEQYPFLLEKNGFRIVLLNYTYGTNGIPVPKPNIINTIDTMQIRKDIRAAKAMNPDAIIAFMHWGVEYTLKPVASQVTLADWLLRQGVTHVIGGHPHVVEPIEVREDAKGDKHVVAYSLGNFVSNQSQEHTYGGMLVKMELEKDTTVRMTDCNYSLYFVTRPVMSGHKQHRVYPVSIPDSLISPAEARLRDTFVNSIRPFFEKNNKNIHEVMTFDISSFLEE